LFISIKDPAKNSKSFIAGEKYYPACRIMRLSCEPLEE